MPSRTHIRTHACLQHTYRYPRTYGSSFVDCPTILVEPQPHRTPPRDRPRRPTLHSTSSRLQCARSRRARPVPPPSRKCLRPSKEGRPKGRTEASHAQRKKKEFRMLNKRRRKTGTRARDCAHCSTKQPSSSLTRVSKPNSELSPLHLCHSRPVRRRASVRRT